MKRPAAVLLVASLAACEGPTPPADQQEASPSTDLPWLGISAFANSCPGPNAVAIVDLGTLPEGEGRDSRGQAINRHGHVVGRSATQFLDHAALWTPLDGWRDLGSLPGSGSSEAQDINDVGQVVGSIMLDAAGGSRAFLWTEATGMRELGAPQGDQLSEAFAINNRGEVVGHSQARRDAPMRAFRWTRTGGFQRLATLPGGRESQARDINEAGQAVGYSTSRDGSHRAVLWTATGQIQDLGTLGGDSSEAHGINDRGEVVGASTTRLGASHAFRWTAATGMRDLGTLPTGSSGEGFSIDNSGRAVGVSSTAWNPFSQATIWTPGGVARALGTLPGGDASLALDINDEAQIVGWEAAIGRRPFHAALWTLFGTRTAEIRVLAAAVQSLVARGELAPDRARALVLTLVRAERQERTKHHRAAARLLDEFAAEVQSHIQGGNLSRASGQALINLATCIRTWLSQ